MLWIARGYGSGRAKLVLAEDFLATYTGGCWNTDIMTTLLALSFASTKVLRLPWIIFSIHFKNLEVSYRILFSHHEIPKAQWCVSWVQSPEQTGRNQHFSCHLRNEQHRLSWCPFSFTTGSQTLSIWAMKENLHRFSPSIQLTKPQKNISLSNISAAESKWTIATSVPFPCNFQQDSFPWKNEAECI